ncbi:MAG TPA: alanine racemase [Chthoniobacterales bacterium]|jgi:alanine racemase
MTARALRCWAEINSEALRRNARKVRERIGSAELLAVIKANAYGHGMIGVAEALAGDVELFGVANLEEAATLRRSVAHPIIILGPALSQERAEIAGGHFIPTISTLEEAEDFNRLATGENVSINFKVDTGMGRMGAPENDALAVFEKIAALPQIHLHSISTHMPASNEDAAYTRDQLARFAKIMKDFRARVPGDYKAHVLQSAGTLAFADASFDIVRAGIILYGISPLAEYRKEFEPVLTWKTRIGLIRDLPKGSSISYGRTFIAPKAMRVGTITAGYADGYPRHLSNRDAAMLVRGRRCQLLGRVTMDLMVIDLSEVPDVVPGEEVVLMGKQEESEIACWELADKADTITWEITTRIGSRVRRVFV